MTRAVAPISIRSAATDGPVTSPSTTRLFALEPPGDARARTHAQVRRDLRVAVEEPGQLDRPLRDQLALHLRAGADHGGAGVDGVCEAARQAAPAAVRR